MNMLTCQELVGFLSDYVDGLLPPETAHAFQRHLAACPDCEAYLFNFRAAISAGKLAYRATADDMPPELARAILASLRPGPAAPSGAQDPREEGGLPGA
jgi:anti-sigma factor RsiW